MRYLFGFLYVCALGVMPLVGCSDTQPECESAEGCNDGNECTDDACSYASGTCSNTPVDDGTNCDFDGTAGLCISGVCEDATLCEGVECEDDGNECTEDVCNPANGTCYVSAEDGTTCSGGACMDGVCTALATASGTVQLVKSFDEDPRAPGATVSVRGTSLSTTTDEEGTFSFDVPVGYVFLESSKADTWGLIDGYPVSQDGIMNLELLVFEDAFVAQMAQEVGKDIDETKGIVLSYYEVASGLGGETVTLSEQYDFSMTMNADGNLVLSDALRAEGEVWLSFNGVDLTDELTVIPKGVDGVSDCRLSDCLRGMCAPAAPGTVYPVVAKFFTTFDIVCTPL
jgi:hypothetical protein